MKYTTYDPTNGQILSAYAGSEEHIQPNLDGKSYISEHYFDHTHYVDLETKTAIAKPANPSTDSTHHDWNPNTRAWELNSDKTSAKIRLKRNQLLQDCDKVSPLWFASLTTAQQQELATYRASLLAVPQQTGFPTSIVWPVKPAWL